MSSKKSVVAVIGYGTTLEATEASRFEPLLDCRRRIDS